uniref:hypothetical protein n=1 Tax=Sutterella wadsworthensis TaxID=40545 RepID=UPI003AB97646
MSQTIEELGVAPEITQPLAIKDSGDIDRFNEASARNLQDMRDLSLYLKDDFVPKMNAARPHLNTILPYAGNVRAVAESIANVNALTPALPAVHIVTDNLPAVQAVSTNIDAVIAALTHARSAKQEADRAKSEADRAAAVSGVDLSTPDIAGLSRPGDGLAVDADGRYSVCLGDFLSLSGDGKINAAHPTVVVVTPTIDTGSLIAIGQTNEIRVSSSSSLVG